MTAATRRPEAAARPALGTGSAACHHGEILQGVFLDERRRPAHALVTLPLYGPGSNARFAHRPGSPPEEVTVTPAGRTKARAAAVLAVRVCAALHDAEPCGGELTLTGDLPVGLGMGSSTSDVIATVRAVADSWGVLLPSETIARIAVRAEGASDPLMHASRPPSSRSGRAVFWKSWARRCRPPWWSGARSPEAHRSTPSPCLPSTTTATSPPTNTCAVCSAVR